MNLWKGRMQFLQPHSEIFNIRSKKIAQCTKIIKNYSFYSEKNPWSVFMGTKKAVFTTSSKNFRRRAKKLSPTVPKGKMKQYFFLKISFWKNVRMGTKKAVFTTSPTVFRQNAKTFNSKSERSIISSVFWEKLSFVNLFFWTHWVQLSQCRQKVFNEAAKLTRSISKTVKQVYFFHKQNVFRKNYGIEPQNAVLRTPPNFSQQMVKMLLLKVRKNKKNWAVSTKILFAQNFQMDP